MERIISHRALMLQYRSSDAVVKAMNLNDYPEPDIRELGPDDAASILLIPHVLSMILVILNLRRLKKQSG